MSAITYSYSPHGEMASREECIEQAVHCSRPCWYEIKTSSLPLQLAMLPALTSNGLWKLLKTSGQCDVWLILYIVLHLKHIHACYHFDLLYYPMK